jgi:hypothetical protein
MRLEELPKVISTWRMVRTFKWSRERHLSETSIYNAAKSEITFGILKRPSYQKY